MRGSEALVRIQRLQFEDKPAAEALLLDVIGRLFPDLGVTGLELRPQATSLNSFNGFLTASDGRRLFFKTHVEQDSAISEYYNAALLADAAYPVIRPLYSSTRDGQQLLVYPIIHDPPVFDVARDIERRQNFGGELARALGDAQAAEDRALYERYCDSLSYVGAETHKSAPIHQLFWHRLTGGRFDRFYGVDVQVHVPGMTVDAATLLSRRWVINGHEFTATLQELVTRAIAMLNPAQSGPSIIGHGDAHNGNVFYSAGGLTYFDPAFAGRHDPLLDLVKPLYHNAYAMWMYFPDEEAQTLQIHLDVTGDTWIVTHNYSLNPLRAMFWSSKIEHCLRPIVHRLHAEGSLSPRWAERLRLALMCCPLLTMNLTTFRPEIALLGLSHCVEFGSETADGASRLDRLLAEISDDLR